MNGHLKQFNNLFGIEDTIKEEQNRFVQRIDQIVFKDIEKYKSEYEKTFNNLCYLLGENANDRIYKLNLKNRTGMETWIPTIRSLTNDNFLETLKVLVLLYKYFDCNPQKQIMISQGVANALSHTTINLGISWKDGMFYPSGVKILDEQLIEDSFKWLDNFPDEKKDFKKALDHYIAKRYNEVVGICYLVIEGLARKILNNDKVLDNNKDALLKKLELSQSWKSLLSNYINYANEFERHASNNRHSINPQEVEAFLYFTGLLIRLIITIR